MARVHPFQTNFTSGEISPKLFGQVDFKKYNNAGDVDSFARFALLIAKFQVCDLNIASLDGS